MKLGLVECFVIDGATNHCTIETTDYFESVTLYWSTNTQGYDLNHFVGTFSSKEFDFKRVQNDNRRIYYHLEFNDGTKLVTGERILKIPGMYNFRDMGGYPTKDGRHVQWGLLYRGDQLYNLQDEGVEYVESLGLKSVIDFRSKGEIEQFPNRKIKTVDNNFNFSPEAEIAVFAGKLQNNEISDKGEQLREIAQEKLSENPKAGAQNMIDQQRKFVTDEEAIESFRNTIRVVLEAHNAPIFQHCKGGKDRTGFAALIQLALLGVEEKYLIYDYMLTRVARSEKNKRYYQNFLDLTGNKEYADYFYALFDTNEEYIQAALSEIDSTYDSIVSYAKDKYRLTDADIERLRDFYLV